MPGGTANAVDPTESPSPTAPEPCSASVALADKDLGTPYVYAVNLDSGQELVNIRGDQTTPTASVLKLVTVAWSTKYLSLDYKAKTTVLVDPAAPSTIYLRGGGDHTLSRLSGSSYSTYSGKAPRLDTLVADILAKWPAEQPLEKIVVDTSFFEGGGWNPNWSKVYRTSGDMALISALQLDGDRKNPDLTDKKYSGLRSTNPPLTAAKIFKSKLGTLASNAKISFGRTPVTATELSSIESRTAINWMRHALMVSDNTETEMIAFHAAKAAGYPANWRSTTKLAKRFMRQIGINPKKLVFADNSGLADANRVTPKAVVAVIQAIQNDTGNLHTVKSLLPVSGVSGSLATRLTGSTRGKVFAKVGYIPGLVSLAGFIDAKDGSHLGFAIFARKEGKTKLSAGTKPAIDRLVKRMYACGAGLTK